MTILFSEEDANIVRNQLIVKKQTNPVFETSLKCVLDSAYTLDMHVTIVGMANTQGNVTSFVVIMRDDMGL